MRLYAELETGAECERLAPTLVALAAGTASSEALLELRPHLRNCAGCRATVRELHASRLRRAHRVLPLGALIEPARAVVERLPGRPARRRSAGRAAPDGAGRAARRGVPAPERWRVGGQPIAPRWPRAPGGSRASGSTCGAGSRRALQRLQSSDVAIGVHAATSGGGGRITSVAALIGICVSRRGRGHLLRRDRAAPGSEAGDPGRGEAVEASQEAVRDTDEQVRAAHLERATRPCAEHGNPHAALRLRSPRRAAPPRAAAGATDEFSFETSADGPAAQRRAGAASELADAASRAGRPLPGPHGRRVQ